PLRGPVSEKAKAVFLCGNTEGRIFAALDGCGVPLTRCGNFDEAVKAAAAAAKDGDAVVLSPACASFDEFKNFAERGKRFAQLVDEL
ncbi:MAG: UDP-N-acetylmuramoyl-L-alanine--D-glutamate ligase, partial [Clostridia bacterium]|nr:UDP-N-acetylmuramoyl-L-alanine--D-glutamate ligase [Clostridia bacterium]